MKRFLCILFLSFLLAGCSIGSEPLDDVIALRENLLKANGCRFVATIFADYGSEIYEFQLECVVDTNGDLRFSILKPDAISGIAGIIDDEGGKLTFDDIVLAFPLLAEGRVSPVSAPWLMLKTLRGGYISAAGEDEDNIHAIIYDSYDDRALRLDFWFDAQHTPVRCEILWEGRRTVSIDVVNFEIL